LISSPAHPQGYDRDRGKKTARDVLGGAITFQYTALAGGIGSFFYEESVTFDTKAMFVPIQFHGVGLPFIKSGTSTGLGVEVHPGSVSFDENGFINVRQVDYRLWSITRMPVSAIPWSKLRSGTPSRTFVGTDILLDEGGEDYTEAFEARFVIGGDLGVIGPGNLVLEVYSFQRDIPIAFAVFYGF
jgi:hypothetical protein